MHCVERKWTLIRYAGSASEASTDSRPIGSELEPFKCTLLEGCQVFLSRVQSYPLQKRYRGHS
jgi:hypothetical protein